MNMGREPETSHDAEWRDESAPVGVLSWLGLLLVAAASGLLSAEPLRFADWVIVLSPRWRAALQIAIYGGLALTMLGLRRSMPVRGLLAHLVLLWLFAAGGASWVSELAFSVSGASANPGADLLWKAVGALVGIACGIGALLQLQHPSAVAFREPLVTRGPIGWFTARRRARAVVAALRRR